MNSSNQAVGPRQKAKNEIGNVKKTCLLDGGSSGRVFYSYDKITHNLNNTIIQ